MKTNRHTRLHLANGKIVRNRIVVPPMASQTADKDGFVTDEMLNRYQRLSQANAGLLVVEYTFVHVSGRSETKQLGIQSDEHVPGLSKLAQIIQKSGALAGLQISHSGGKTERNLTSGYLQGPSAIVVPVKDHRMEVPEPMTTAEIQMWKEAFVRASDRAALAGFDLVEIHSAHGYGLNQWLSPVTNHRNDDYGDGIQGRIKLLLEIATLIRARHPQLLLSVRIPGQDFIEGGLVIQDMISVARALERAGVHILSISSGIGGWRRPKPRFGEGYLVAEAEKIQSAVGVPVIGVGGIETGAYVDEALQANRFALAAIGRAILGDPMKWRQTQMREHE